MSWLDFNTLRGLGASADPCAEWLLDIQATSKKIADAGARGDGATIASLQHLLGEQQFRYQECRQRTAAGQSPSPYVAPTPAEVAAADEAYQQRVAQTTSPAAHQAIEASANLESLRRELATINSIMQASASVEEVLRLWNKALAASKAFNSGVKNATTSAQAQALVQRTASVKDAALRRLQPRHAGQREGESDQEFFARMRASQVASGQRIKIPVGDSSNRTSSPATAPSTGRTSAPRSEGDDGGSWVGPSIALRERGPRQSVLSNRSSPFLSIQPLQQRQRIETPSKWAVGGVVLGVVGLVAAGLVLKSMFGSSGSEEE